MQNFIDLYSTITDDRSEPLYGYIEFFEPDGTTPQNVLNKDEYNIGNKIITNQYGKISSTGDGTVVDQIFLQDEKDYKIVYWKFTGTDFNLDKPNQFSQVKTLDYYYTRITTEIKGIASVNTIDDLRNFDTTTIQEGQVITLLGYNEAGDKPEVNYVWKSESQSTDDGGAYIQPNGVYKGRFIMVARNTVDIRDWGVFGNPLQSEIVYQSSKITAAMYYASTYGCTLIFPNIHISGTWYGFDGGNYVCANCVVEDRAYFYGKENTTNKFISYTFKSSPNSALFVGYWDYIWVDSIYSRNIITTFSPAILGNLILLKCDTVNVYDDNANIRGNINKLNFREVKNNGQIYVSNCEIQSLNQINCTCYIGNIPVKEIYFKEGYDYNNLTIDLTNTLDIDDWESTEIWWKLINRLNITDYGDVKGRTFTKAISDSYSPAHKNFKMTNAIFDNFEIKAGIGNNITLEKCSGTFKFDMCYELNLVDCDLTASTKFEAIMANIVNSSLNGQVDIKSQLTAERTSFTNGTISCAFITMNNCIAAGTVTTLDTLTVEDCTLNNLVTFSGNLTSYRCKYNTIRWNIKAENIVKFDYNTINAGITVYNPYIIAAGTAVVKNSSFTHNTVISANSLKRKLINFNNFMDRFKAIDTEHTYVYDDNVEYHENYYDCSIAYNNANTDITFTGTVLNGSSYSGIDHAEVFNDWYFNSGSGIGIDIFSFGINNKNKYMVNCYIDNLAGDDYIKPIHRSQIYTYLATGTGSRNSYYYARNFDNFSFIVDSPSALNVTQSSTNYRLYRARPDGYINAESNNSQGMAEAVSQSGSYIIRSTGVAKKVRIYYTVTKIS